MSLFSMADLHLSLGSDKPMDIFGPRWTNHTEKIEKRWRAVVTDADTVVVPGDISWAIDLEGALPDLKFIDSLPGKKILGKGNHDYWWSTVTKIKDLFSQNGITTLELLYNNAFECDDYIIAGTRGWYVDDKLQQSETADYEKIVARENIRLRLSLAEAQKLREASGKDILVYFHFPPVFKDFRCGEFIDTMKEFNIKNCYFGHIHGNYLLPKTVVSDGISMTLISADYLNFVPMITMPLDY